MSNLKDFILIVEDEEAIAEGLQFNFTAEGYIVKVISDGIEALSFIREQHKKISTIILDLMLPHLNGYEILKETRSIAERVPIMVLTAKSLESDKIKALELGADDFIMKPFNLTELILRIKRLVQRRTWYQKNDTSPKKSFGDALFDSERFLVEKNNGESVRISPTEGLLIQILLDNNDKILTRSELLQKVWQYDAIIETRTVDVFIGKLRKLVEKNPAKPEYIVSVRGVGYSYVSKPH